MEVRDLTVSFAVEEGELTAVDRVSFEIRRGETVGVVGESGCGKSVTALSLMRLVPSPPGKIASGSVVFAGTDLLRLPAKEMRQVRGRRIGMIFQEPGSALSPLHRIGNQLIEALQLHSDISRNAARELAVQWLKKVGVADAEARLSAYPFELSGGMCQRVMIAMTMMLEPELLIADEPTTALDVTIQAQILELMLALKSRDSSLLLITHDMGIIWETCDRVIVMYASRIAESAPAKTIFQKPRHPYTQALLKSLPSMSAHKQRLDTIKGQVPSLLKLGPGCNFANRCPHAFDRCFQENPQLYQLEDNHKAACFLVE